MPSSPHILVVGLGYVGLPLAVALARKFDVTGFDVDENRIAELHSGHDRTREIDQAELKSSSLKLTSKAEGRAVDVFIITVPTPVDASNAPDLGAVIAATRTVASLIDPSRRPTIVYESTV